MFFFLPGRPEPAGAGPNGKDRNFTVIPAIGKALQIKFPLSGFHVS
jgi:hypothetical protein